MFMPEDAAFCHLFGEISGLTGEQISIVKIFLHISKDEQRRRLQERIDDPTRHWELCGARRIMAVHQ
jgi:polyphosphate kinase 2 (PPK2 family)